MWYNYRFSPLFRYTYVHKICICHIRLWQLLCNPGRCEFESHSGEVYSIQHYVIKIVSDLQQVSDFLWVLRFPPPIKLIDDLTEILLKVVLDTITLNLMPIIQVK